MIDTEPREAPDSTPAQAPAPIPLDRWADPEASQPHAFGGWRSPAAAGRDARLVSRLLRRHGVTVNRALDMPCGTGRRLRALAECLPLADGTFELVVSCRRLHHLESGVALDTVVGKLASVSGEWIAASCWDSASLESLTRGLRHPRPGGTRRARPASVLERAFADASAPVAARAHSLRFFSPQVFPLARKYSPARG